MFKEANKKHPTAQIAKIHWTNEKLASWEPSISEVKSKEDPFAEQKKGSKENWTNNIEVHEVCYPRKNLADFFQNFE